MDSYNKPLSIIAIFFFLIFSSQLTAQSRAFDLDKTSETISKPLVKYISQTPIIDGQLDANLKHLDELTFNYIWQFDNPVTDTAQVSYRMAYTSSHLYVYIETDVDSVSYHRRGYLWGDGYKILLGIPQRDSLTNEYYELAYSPAVDKTYWERQRIQSYNFSQIRKRLSQSSKTDEKAQLGKSGFETLIAWEDIKPYHPWFLNQIGINIYFAKGIESAEHGYFTNGYSIVEDEGIWDEEIPRRNYQLLCFEQPSAVSKAVILASPGKHNIDVGEPLQLVIRSMNNLKTKDDLHLTFSDSNANVIVSKQIDVQLDNTLQKENYKINLGELQSGSYQLIVNHDTDTIVNEVIVIQPTIDFEKITTDIQDNKFHLETGTANTLQFELNQIENKLADLKDYETGEAILEDWKVFQIKYKSYNLGVDPFETFTEPYRRAFKSKYDNTYQPYSIKLPKNYDSSKTYPLLVFLHGSGGDEIGLLDRPRSGGNFIEIAPLARDIFRAYSEDEAQKDIIEAIEDVSTYFPVDKDKIIIGGFSMGGYGALRTFHEHPKLYKGIAVHAGHPNLANEWMDGDHPNFLDEKYLSSFSNMPVFIYHGRKDPALDVGLIEKMREKLIKAGAIVTQSIVAENAHEYPDDETNKVYFDWLSRIANR